jgi:hypothetical protein
MDFDKANKALTLFANFGVVAGLGFLAIEVRQNQVVLEQNQSLMERQYQLQVVDSHQAIADSVDELRLTLGGDTEVAKIWINGLKGLEMTEAEQLQFESLCDLKIWNDAISYRRLRILGRPNDADNFHSSVRGEVERWPGYTDCWENNVQGLRNWGYEDLVNGVQNADPETRTQMSP